MVNDIKKLAGFLLLEIHNVIDKSNGFIPFDLVKLAAKYKTSKALIKETFIHLENQEEIDLFMVKGDKRKVGVIYRHDPRRQQLIKQYEKILESR